MVHNTGYTLWLERVITIPHWEWITAVTIVAVALVSLFRILIPLGFSIIRKKLCLKKFFKQFFLPDAIKPAYLTDHFFIFLVPLSPKRIFWIKLCRRKKKN